MTPEKSRRRWFQFRLRSLLLLFIVASVVLSWWTRDDEQTYPAAVGHAYMDRSLSIGDRELVIHVTGALTARSPPYSPLGKQIVVVVPNCKTITRKVAKEIAEHPDFSNLNPEVHFIELINQNTAKIRSFGGRWCWERSEHLAGALTAVMVMDQLSYRVPKHLRKPMGLSGNPAKIVFSTGNVLKVDYTNDWGSIYLREVEGPAHLTERLQTTPYTNKQRAHEQDLAARIKQGLLE